MALVSCSECGKQVSDKAASCPHCGVAVAPVEQTNAVATGGFKWWLWVPIALVVIFFAFPYLAHSPAERAAISARADCERVFPAERGGKCDQVYNDVLLGRPNK